MPDSRHRWIEGQTLAEAAAPRWSGPPVWTHGDLFPTNVLAMNGQVTAVIDFGLVGVGDPAVDLLPAWTILDAQTRELFRRAARVDDHTWARGRGWALAAGLGAIRFYRRSDHPLATAGWRAVAATTADSGR